MQRPTTSDLTCPPDGRRHPSCGRAFRNKGEKYGPPQDSEPSERPPDRLRRHIQAGELSFERLDNSDLLRKWRQGDGGIEEYLLWNIARVAIRPGCRFESCAPDLRRPQKMNEPLLVDETTRNKAHGLVREKELLLAPPNQNRMSDVVFGGATHQNITGFNLVRGVDLPTIRNSHVLGFVEIPTRNGSRLDGAPLARGSLSKLTRDRLADFNFQQHVGQADRRPPLREPIRAQASTRFSSAGKSSASPSPSHTFTNPPLAALCTPARSTGRRFDAGP